MIDQKVKELLSINMKNITDAGLQTVLRRILFSTNNKIDWQDAYRMMLHDMPELTIETESKTLVDRILEGADVRGILTSLRSESKLEGNRVIVNIDPKYRDNFYEKLKKCYVLPEVIMESDERLQIVFPSEDDIRSKFNAIMKDVINYVE